MREPFQFVEHTADVCLRVYGDTLEDLFKNAAKGLFFLIVGEDKKHGYKKNIVRDVSLQGSCYEDLLVYWLNELISIFFTYKYLPYEYNVCIGKVKDFYTLNAVLKGTGYDPYSNLIKMEIKAATYCGLKIKSDKKNNKEMYSTDIVFDV